MRRLISKHLTEETADLAWREYIAQQLDLKYKDVTPEGYDTDTYGLNHGSSGVRLPEVNIDILDPYKARSYKIVGNSNIGGPEEYKFNLIMGYKDISDTYNKQGSRAAALKEKDYLGTRKLVGDAALTGLFTVGSLAGGASLTEILLGFDPRKIWRSLKLKTPLEKLPIHYYERPSKLSLAEKLGIPKGDRNLLTADLLLSLEDLMLYVNSGSKRQLFTINPENTTFKWTDKPDATYLPFMKWFADSGKSMKGSFAKVDALDDYGLSGLVRFLPETNSASWLTVPTKTTDLLEYNPGEAIMFGLGTNTYSMRLTAPKTDIKQYIEELELSKDPTEIALAALLKSELPNTLDKTTMKSFWTGVGLTLRPGSYLSGDAAGSPLGDQLIRNFKEHRFTLGIDLWNNSARSRIRRVGLSPDSYSSIIRLALREGNSLRWGEGFTRWNDSAVTNRKIYEAQLAYQKGEISAEQYKLIFDDWSLLLGGRPATIKRIPLHTETTLGNDGNLVIRTIPSTEDVIIPHPFIFKKNKGGKLKLIKKASR